MADSPEFIMPPRTELAADLSNARRDRFVCEFDREQEEFLRLVGYAAEYLGQRCERCERREFDCAIAQDGGYCHRYLRRRVPSHG